MVFEGKDVYYSQVFDSAAHRVGDTDLEAQELFKYFRPGCAKVPFGKGSLIFNWNGQVVVPTKAHFITNWSYFEGNTHKEGNVVKSTFCEGRLRPIWGNFQLAPLNQGKTFFS